MNTNSELARIFNLIHWIWPGCLAVGLMFFSLNLPAVWMSVGVIIGYWLMFSERALLIWWQPETELHHYLRQLASQHQYRQLLVQWWRYRDLQTQLVTKSLIFFGCYLALAVYILTSVKNYLGIGVIIGLGWHLVIDAWRYQLSGRFWPIFAWQLALKQPTKRIEQLICSAMTLLMLVVQLYGLRWLR